MTEHPSLPPFVFAIVGYAFVLIAALVIVNVLLHRLTRGERSGRRRGRERRG